LDLSQDRVAEKTGLSLRYIQSLEAGEYHPPIPTLLRLKMALRCQWNDFYVGCSRVN
jgi:predicted transcriptional regulator